MTDRRPVHIGLAVLLLLVVLTAVADAGSAGPSTARETGASAAGAGTGSSATVQPGEKPADGGFAAPGTPAVATTGAPARATVREESGAAAGRDSGTARAVGEATPRPGVTPATTSPAGTDAGTGGDGAGTATAGADATPAPTAVPSAIPTVARASSGPAPMEDGGGSTVRDRSDRPTTVPSVVAATARSTATAAFASAPAATRDRIGSAVVATAPPAREARAAERGQGSGSQPATGSPGGTDIAPGPDHSWLGGAETAPSSRHLAAAVDPVLRGGPHPAVSPTPGHQYAPRLGTKTGEAATVRAGGVRHDETRDGPRSQNGEERRGPPAHAAKVPVAAPARTGLEPPGPGENGAGRARKGDLPLAAPMGTDGGVPDPLFLFRFLLFLGYRRIRPGNVLDHPVRRDLSAAVAADPGLDLAGCVAATGANRETLRYHLSLLVVSGKVVEETRNGSVRYFPHDPALTPVHRAVLHYRRNPSLAPLLYHIRDAPGISRLELAARLDLAGPTVTRQVQRLVDEGLVEPRRCGRSQRYWLTPPCAGAFAALEAAGAVHAEAVRAFDRASA